MLDVLRVDWPRVADVSTVLGAGCWSAFPLVPEAVFSASAVHPVLAVTAPFAFLVLVPLQARLADLPAAAGARSWWYALALGLQFPAAILATLSLFRPAGPQTTLLALPWLAVTVALALFGVQRIRPHGIEPLSAFAVSAGLLYLPVAGGALVLHRMGISFFFSSTIVFLTVVHFHYAAGVFPVVAGLTGQFASERALPYLRLYRYALVVVVVNPALIAIGITASPVLEVAAAVTFAIAVVVVSLYGIVLVVPALASISQKLLLSTSSIAIVVGMAYAVGYALTAFGIVAWLTIPDMLWTHGLVNAFGFALPGLLAWRIDHPESALAGLSKP
jgi:hypothetical protein